MRIADFFIVALGLLLFYSCSNSEKSDKIVYLTEEDLPPIKTLKLEKVDLPEDYTMGDVCCFVYQDTVLLVLRDGNPYPLTHMLTLVNMNTWEKIGEYITRGRGPDELLSTLPRFSHNHMDICCYTTGRLIPFNIDSAIMLGNDYKPSIIQNEMSRYILEWCSMDDSLFLTYDKFYFDHDKEFKQHAQIPEFYWFGKSGKITPEFKESDFGKIKAIATNVTGSSISINKNKNRVVCCYAFQPYIKVFDLNMNLLRTISGPDPDDGKYTLINGNMIYFDPDEGRREYYYFATCDEDNIFVINRRLHKNNTNGGEIYKLDWEGNVVARYVTKDVRVRSITTHNYCKNNNTLYLWTNHDNEGTMYKAQLD